MASLPDVAHRVRAAALLYPESFEELPWGDRVVKVRGKIFLMCGVHKGRLGVTCKLPATGQAMLAAHAFAKPTAYGLGKSGWVSASFGPDDDVPTDLLLAWIDESYRCVAPKALLKLLPADGMPTKRPPMDLSSLQAFDLPAPVLILGADELRVERAAQTLTAAGHRAAHGGFNPGAFVAAEELGGVCAVVVDLVREREEGIVVGADVAMSFDAELVLAGVKDGKQEALLRQALPEVRLFGRKAPGSLPFLKQLAQLLG